MRTVGQVLKTARKSKNHTLLYIYDQIKIQPKYIKALEAGDYSIFSSKVHAKGFVKIYAEFLELNVNELLAFWRREYEAELEKQDLNKKKTSFISVKNPLLLLTPTFGVLIIGAFLIIGFFSYLYYQYSNYSKDPLLQLNNVSDNMVVQDNVLDISGKTDPDSELFLNMQRINIALDGSFITSIKLNLGINNVIIEAKNAFGKSTTKHLNIINRSQQDSVIHNIVNTSQTSESSQTTPSSR